MAFGSIEKAIKPQRFNPEMSETAVTTVFDLRTVLQRVNHRAYAARLALSMLNNSINVESRYKGDSTFSME